MADQKDEWDDLMGEIESEKSAQKKRAAMNAAADDILKAGAKADKADAAEGNEAEPDAGAAAIARIEELELELATLKDQSLRALAEAENVKSLPRGFSVLSVSPMISSPCMTISPAR